MQLKPKPTTAETAAAIAAQQKSEARQKKTHETDSNNTR